MLDLSKSEVFALFANNDKQIDLHIYQNQNGLIKTMRVIYGYVTTSY